MALSLPGAWREGDSTITLYVKDLRNPFDRRWRLLTKPWSTIKDIKDRLQTLLAIPASRLRLYCEGQELKNPRNLPECGIFKDGAVLTLTVACKNERCTIRPFGRTKIPKELLKVLYHAQKGLALGFAPELAMDGTGGTYFLRDEHRRFIGCFKPQDEEPYAPKNPRGFIGELGKVIDMKSCS